MENPEIPLTLDLSTDLILTRLNIPVVSFHYHAGMFGDASPTDLVASQIPQGLKLRIYHVSTPPTLTSALFASAPDQQEQKTFCESHFLVVALPARQEYGELLLFGIEVLVFTTSSLTTIFISKADTSGLGRDVPSVTASIITSFLGYILSRNLGAKKLVLSLFARSQSQYLFPGSIENTTKHVLDDRQLIKWWCKVLDPIVRQSEFHISASQSHQVQAHLVVPGCDRAETRAFFPPSARYDTDAKWINLYPLDLMVVDPSQPLRCLIPRLPDDPKARFLNDLDEEFIGSEGQWRNVRSMERFWEMMSYRQECSAGRLVGFIWVTFWKDDGNLKDQENHDSPDPVEAKASTKDSITLVSEETLLVSRQSASTETPGKATREGHLAEPANKVNDKEQANSFSALHDQDKTLLERSSEQDRGHSVLEDDQYEALMDHLLRLDFAGVDEAVKSTKSWVGKLGGIWGNEHCGIDVVGCKATASEPGKLAQPADGPTTQVNLLTAIKKKRKADDSATQSQASVESVPVTSLGAGLVRKKPKA